MNKDYVILLHGLGRTANSMQKIERSLLKEGYHVINIDYPSRAFKIENLAQTHLKEIIEQKCTDKNKKIHFITHSMGGILVRYFLATNRLKNAGRIIMLAPPNKGSNYADFFSKFKIANLILGPALMQMTTAKKSLSNTLPEPEVETGVIAGKYDGKVSIENTKLQKMTDFLLVPRVHTNIMNSPKVLDAINNFLAKGTFTSS